MKNHFVFSWCGNKRQEVEKIYNNLPDITNITTVIEPFCGTSAFSFYLASLHPRRFKYILNDNDIRLIELYNIMKDPIKLDEFEIKINDLCSTITNKDIYMTLINKDNVEGYYISHKIYSIVRGLHNINYKYKQIDIKSCPIVHFLQSEDITISSYDAVELYKLHVDNIETLLFMDPSYMQSCNSWYCDNHNLNIYEYIYNNSILKHSACIVFVLESNWIIRLLFKDYNNKIEYDKKYDLSRKKTTHLIITNK